MNRRNLFAKIASSGSRPAASLGPEYYTNTVLRTHENKEVRFYDDLIKGKLVVFNFMYANCQGACPMTTANLLKVQHALKNRVGKDIFMYSITLKPEEDDPKALKEYAEMHGVKPGWLFLTGDPFELTTIRFRLFRWDNPGLDFDVNQHTGMVRIINDTINRWSMCPTLAQPYQIVNAISWAEPTKPYKVRLQENIAAQARIDRESQRQR